jgi:hypothetical protein
MSYASRNLVPGETLLFETRHHWIVLLGPLLVSLLLGLPGLALLVGAIQAKSGKDPAARAGILSEIAAQLGPQGTAVLGGILLVAAIIVLSYGLAKRNATIMAVTNRRVLIKTGMTSRRTLDLMLSKVESIGVDETFLGRMLGFGSVVVHGTGGTPESFVNIANPQQLRRSVQEQIAPR